MLVGFEERGEGALREGARDHPRAPGRHGQAEQQEGDPCRGCCGQAGQEVAQEQRREQSPLKRVCAQQLGRRRVQLRRSVQAKGS